MATLNITIEYSQGQTTIAAHLWPIARSDDVQQVTAECNGLSVMFQAQSIYWFYPEGENWIIGAGSVRYDPNPLTEVVIAPDGTQTERKREYMPDLTHDRVKLGWFKDGKDVLSTFR